MKERKTHSYPREIYQGAEISSQKVTEPLTKGQMSMTFCKLKLTVGTQQNQMDNTQHIHTL